MQVVEKRITNLSGTVEGTRLKLFRATTTTTTVTIITMEPNQMS